MSSSSYENLRFCQECFEEFSKRMKTCPVCRENIDVRSCKEDSVLEREIASGTVVCWACGQKVCCAVLS